MIDAESICVCVTKAFACLHFFLHKDRASTNDQGTFHVESFISSRTNTRVARSLLI